MVGGQLRRLTSLRWFAALAVFGDHLAMQSREHGVWRLLVPGGAIGVEFFFVLSGFVLAWSYRPGQGARIFWRNRFARIYPATLVSLMVGIALSGWVLAPARWVSTLMTATLVQSWVPPPFPIESPNPVLWSLSCEAFFYLLFPALIWVASRHRPGWLLAAALAGEVVVIAFAAHRLGDGYYLLPAARLPEFALGVALARFARDGWRPQVPLAIAASLLAGGWVLMSGYLYPQDVGFFALPGVVAVLLWAAGRDMDGTHGMLRTRPAVYLGELSFCFYLMHWLVVQTLPVAGIGPVAGLLVGLPVAVGAAVLLHHGIELPMQRLLRFRADLPRASSTPDSAKSALRLG